MNEIRVGIIGFGTVGKGLAEVLLAQQERLVRRTGMSIRLAGIADHGTDALPERFSHVPLTRDARDLISDPKIDIIVELIGGIEPAKTFVLEAIEAGKHVITPTRRCSPRRGATSSRPRPRKAWRSASRPASAAASR